MTQSARFIFGLLLSFSASAYAELPPTRVPARGFQLDCTELCLVPPPAAEGTCYSSRTAKFWSSCSDIPRDAKCLADAQRYLSQCPASDGVFACILQMTATYVKSACASIPGDDDSSGIDSSVSSGLLSTAGSAGAGGAAGGLQTEPPAPPPLNPRDG